MASNIQQVSFTSPGYDYSANLSEIERRKELAKMLQAQSMAPIEQQTAGGYVVPIHPLQGVAKMAQAYLAGRTAKSAQNEQLELSARAQRDLADVLRRGGEAITGTEAKTINPDQQELQQAADQGGTAPKPTTIPAQAPDPMAAANIYLSHPSTAGLGMAAAQQAQSAQQLAQILKTVGGTQGATAPAGPAAGPGLSADGAAAAGGALAATQPGMQPAPSTAAPGGFQGVSPQAIALMASGNPMAGKIGEAVQAAFAERNKPIVGREGAPVLERNPDGSLRPTFYAPKTEPGIQLNFGPGGSVTGASPVAGYTGARAGIVGAEEGAKAGFDVIQVPDGRGGTVRMTRAEYLRQTGQTPAGQTAVPGSAAGAMPGGRNRLGYESGPGPQKTEVVMGEGLGKRYNEIQDAGYTANQKIQKFSRLGNLLESVDTGKLSPGGFELAAYAKSLGMNVGANVDNAQAAKSIANEIALELRNPAGGAGMPGAMSDKDREFLQSMVANLDKTPGANALLVEGMKKFAQRERDISQLARNYKKKNGGVFDDGFYDELQKFADANPMFEAPRGSQSPSATPRVVQFNQLPQR